MGGNRGSNPKRLFPSQLRRLRDAADGRGQDRVWAESLDASSRLILSVARRAPRRHDVIMARYAFAVEGFGSKATGDSVQFKGGAPAHLTSAIRSAGCRLPTSHRSPLAMNARGSSPVKGECHMHPHSLLRSSFVLVAAACGGSGSTAPDTSPKLAITVPTRIESGTSVQATANVTTASGATSAATDVTWNSSNPSVASISAAGVITGALQGVSIISATSAGMSAQINVRVDPGAPSVVTVYAGSGQGGVAGSRLGDPLCTNVKDAAGNLIVGAVVTYTVMTGGGSLAEPTTVATGTDYIARSGLWTLGPNPGTQTVRADVPGATSATFMAIAR